MKLLSLNIEGDIHLDAVIHFVRQENPDIVCFNEAFEDDAAMFKHAFDMDGFFVPSATIKVANHFRVPVRGNIGSLVLTRGNIINTSVTYYDGDARRIPELSDQDGNAANRFLLQVDIAVGDEVYTVITTHFTITKNGEVSQLQRDNLQKILKFLALQKEFVFCGDFNAPRGREIFDTLATHYQDNIPVDVKTTLDKNIHRVGEQLPDLVVDGLFTSPGILARNVRVVPGISDHYAVVANISHQD